MKTTLTLVLFLNLCLGLVSCQTNSLKVVFTSPQKDTATELNHTKVYTLKKKAVNADFNYSKLSDIDSNIGDTVNVKNLMPIFEPVNGRFIFYQFISTYKGHSFREIDTVFHDILIVKTDDKKQIIDAYQYTLEWAEMPLQYDLFKSNARGLVLVDNLEISTFKFLRTDNSSDDKVLKDDGHISLK